MPELKISLLPYKDNLLQKWKDSKRNNCGMLDSSRASEYLKEILKEKRARRCKGTRRFFGEAYVATTIPHRYGYYGSFRWLTNPKYTNDHGFPEGSAKKYQEQLREALGNCFTRSQLNNLQKKAESLSKLAGKKPVPPDLWLIDRQGNHRFIEVKLPGDKIRCHQLAGLAVIACCLHGSAGVSVEIVELYPEGFHPRGETESLKKTFRNLCSALRVRGQKRSRLELLKLKVLF